MGQGADALALTEGEMNITKEQWQKIISILLSAAIAVAAVVGWDIGVRPLVFPKAGGVIGSQAMRERAGLDTPVDTWFWNGADVTMYSDNHTTQKIKLDGGTGAITAASVANSGNLVVTGDVSARNITATGTISTGNVMGDVTGDITVVNSLKGQTIPMTGSTTRPIDLRATPVTPTSYLNTELMYLRANLDKALDETVGSNDGFTVLMSRGYISATQGGGIFEGGRFGINVTGGYTVSDAAGAGYIAGARVTTYVPDGSNAKTNKGLIIAPRDDTSIPAISGSQYIGAQIYLKQATAKAESWGLDIYTEPGSDDLDAAINIRNGSTEKYTYGIDMNDATAPGKADIRLSNGNVVAATDGQVVYNTMHDVTIAEIKAGHTIVTVPADLSFRLVDVTAIAYGGSCATVTTVDISSTVNLVTYAQANLVQNTPLVLDSTGVTLIADGASFTAQTAGQDIKVGQTGADVATCTGIRFILSYVLQ